MEKQVRAGKSEKVLLSAATLFLCALLLMSGQERRARPAGAIAAETERPVSQETFVPEVGPVNLNTAGAEELETLPGIGPVLARRIVEYRAAHGPFQTVEELLEVSGVGEAKLAGLAGEVILNGGE